MICILIFLGFFKAFAVLKSQSWVSAHRYRKIHIDYIFSETNSVLLEYEKKYSRTLSKVIFTGGGALLKGLSEVAANNFRAEIEVGSPFDKVNAPAFLEKVLKTIFPWVFMVGDGGLARLRFTLPRLRQRTISA